MSYEVRTVENGDNPFPRRLEKIKPRVDKLYYKGAFDEKLFENCLAVVGTRRITEYGKNITKKLVHEVAGTGVTIVSGFMFGVDAESHRAALEVGGRTIAVMPCGIDLITPAYQEELYYEILENNGCVLSELEGDNPPARWTFAQRNRIVAGLSRATLIIEGGERSGTLITAEFAKKYGSELLAVPGPITSNMAAAPNKLIKEGARVVTCSRDILKAFNMKEVELPSIGDEVNEGLLGKVINLLRREPLGIDDIIRKVKVSSSELNIILSEMELAGNIKEKSGKYYAM